MQDVSCVRKCSWGEHQAACLTLWHCLQYLACNAYCYGIKTEHFLYDGQVSVLEMDGQFDKLEELIYIESHLSNTSAKFYGEITQQMLKNSHFPGSNNGTGLFQTICGLKLREVYEALVQQEVKPVV